MGLSSVRCATGIALMRAIVASADALRAACPAFDFAREVAGEDLPGDALGDVAVRALDEVVVPLQRGERRHDVEHLVRRVDLGRDLRPLLDAVGGEQLGDGVPGIHRDERDHRLAAEQLLVRDVVLVDLVALVEIVALVGRELELGRAEAEPDGEDPRRAAPRSSASRD